MKKRLTEAELLAALEGLDVGAQTEEIARGVLVHGRPQAEFVEAFGLSRGAVSQAVNRVWEARVPTGCARLTVLLPQHQASLVEQWAAETEQWVAEYAVPPGCERLTVVLPKHQAYIVKKWAEEFAKKREEK
ncbi:MULTISPECIES: TrfB-related DNA-binding protein [Pseudomonas]|uniref:TrfB-related DNA-binding protein n=1 Tax=Pseudomonas aeruginosa TaxID=287 RepID=UPI0020B80B7B|nr:MULTISPECIES: TrfB-related DNA-binding protein [Pseudomonas]UTH38919.1 TrfB-related DNA-binding protein [Pseudomonas sp. KHPS1]